VQLDGLVKVFKDARIWQIGTIREVDWIVNRTTDGQSITVAIPPVFEAYATFYEPDGISLFFPEDRPWLVSGLWDDTWTCLGGSNSLIQALEHDPLVQAHRVTPDDDATPQGVIAIDKDRILTKCHGDT